MVPVTVACTANPELPPLPPLRALDSERPPLSPTPWPPAPPIPLTETPVATVLIVPPTAVFTRLLPPAFPDSGPKKSSLPPRLLMLEEPPAESTYTPGEFGSVDVTLPSAATDTTPPPPPVPPTPGVPL